jgi:tungstate transport system substrate-binding protein
MHWNPQVHSTHWRLTAGAKPSMRSPILILVTLWIAAGCAIRTGSSLDGQVPADHNLLPGIPTAQPGNTQLVLATTTSTQDSGLLEVLIPRFEQLTGYQVKTVAVGTGQALALGARGEADAVLVHAPAAERSWMSEGNGADRRLVMHNDFVVVGPPADPAGIKARSLLDALRIIAGTAATWVSRDDNSGTDQLEKQLWLDLGIDPKPEAWYLASGQGMSATLTLADQKDAYTITDRATYLARRSSLQSVVLVEGDPQLLNLYHVMNVNPTKFPGIKVNHQGAVALTEFLVTPLIQQTISEFGKDRYGQALFFPDAGKTEDEFVPR